MEKTKNQKFILAFVAFVAVIVMSVVVITSFATAKPVLAEEDYGIEPYFCNDRTETVTIGGEQFKYKFDGNDAVWPLWDSIKVMITSVNGCTFNYDVKITFYYHLVCNDPENTKVNDVSTWSGTATGNVQFKKDGQDHSYGGKKYHQYDVFRARIDITMTYGGVTETRPYDLYYHL